MEELNEEGGETARLHSGQTEDLQDKTSERMCMYCRKNINFVLFLDVLFNKRMTANRSNTCTSYGPLTQKLMAVCHL